MMSHRSMVKAHDKNYQSKKRITFVLPMAITMKNYSLACIFLKELFQCVYTWKFPHNFSTLQHLHFPRPFYSSCHLHELFMNNFVIWLSSLALSFFIINLSQELTEIHEIKNICIKREIVYIDNFYV